MTYTRPQVAHLIDHTLLKPEATSSDIAIFVREARELGVGAICVHSSMLDTAAQALIDTEPATSAAATSNIDNTGTGFALKNNSDVPLLDSSIKLACVCGFPSGAHQEHIKATEAHDAILAGASEVDMVANLSFIAEGDFRALENEVACVKHVLDGRLLKVIIETGLWNDSQIRDACRAAEAGGADFVKTSTGFHPCGGATTHAVEIMRSVVSAKLGVKASGGIRDAATAKAMLDAGANRLGVSSAKTILQTWDD